MKWDYLLSLPPIYVVMKTLIFEHKRCFFSVLCCYINPRVHSIASWIPMWRNGASFATFWLKIQENRHSGRYLCKRKEQVILNALLRLFFLWKPPGCDIHSCHTRCMESWFWGRTGRPLLVWDLCPVWADAGARTPGKSLCSQASWVISQSQEQHSRLN